MKKIVSSVMAVAMFLSLIVYTPCAQAASNKAKIINAQASSFIASAENLYNKNFGDMYSSQNEPAAWIILELNTYYDVSAITLYSRTDYLGFPISFDILSSQNGVDWSTVPNGEIRDYSKPTIAANTFTFGETVTARYLKIQTVKSYNDGGSDLTQFAEVEVIGTVATVTNPDADQDYSLDFVGTNSVRWYQFENMERKSYYVSGSFYIPYYINPIVGETNSKRPAVALVDDRWVLLYQGADGIYFSQTQDSSITSSWAYPKKLIANGSYDMLESPSICTDGTDTYIALTGIRDSTSELIVVPYTLSATSISISTSSILKITDISAGNPRNPSLIYDGKWKLYYQTTSNNVNSMHLAVAIGGAPNSFTQKNTLEKLVDGTVVKLKSGYAALFKTYDTSGQSMTEWAYSEDGVDFTRRSTLLDRIFLENQKYYSTGDAVIAIDGDGIIHGVFSESWKDKEDDSFLTLFLPQRKAVLSYQFMFLNNSMALSSSVQAVAGERDYTVTDRVTVYESPNSEPKYEKRRAISQSSSIFLRNMEDPGKLPTKAFAIDTSADDGLAIINPLEAVASDYLFEATSGEMVIDYLNVTGWQTNAPFTTDQPARSLTVKLSGNEQIDVIKFTMNNNGYSFPKDFYFEYSNNGSDWTIMPGMVFVNYPVVTGTEVVFNCPSPVKATYVRLIATRYETAQTNTACLQISKIYFLGKTVAQENQYIEKVAGEAETWDYKGETLSKVDIVSATASSELVGWDVSQIIDGKYDNAWSSQADTAGNKDEWVALDLGSTYSVARVELFPRSDNALFPINYKIQYSMDGSTWSDAPGGAVTGNPTPRTGYRNYVTFTSPVRAKYIRLYITKKRTDGGNFMTHLSDIEVHKVN